MEILIAIALFILNCTLAGLWLKIRDQRVSYNALYGSNLGWYYYFSAPIISWLVLQAYWSLSALFPNCF